MVTPSDLMRADGERVAYLRRDGTEPGIVWLGGFLSDMAGTKAAALDGWAKNRGRACVRFDYFGHGASSGNFRQATITRWRDDALAVLDELTQGPQILVGSSMGGWLSLLVAKARPERIAGLVLIAPAPDFTEALMWEEFPADVRAQILGTGEWLRPSQYGDPQPITRMLVEDGRKHLVLGSRMALPFPVRILQGMHDPDVPWQHAMKLVDMIDGDVTITLVKDGDHRLSTPANIALLLNTLEALT